MSDKEPAMSPGAYVRMAMDAKGWTQSDLAYALGVPAAAINQILNDKRAISNNMALSLSAAFGIDAREIARIQADWDIQSAEPPDPDIKARALVLSHYPLREMIRRGWIDPENGRGSLEDQVCRFFGVSRISEIPHLEHSAKKSNYEKLPPEQLAWLFRVKAIAAEMNSRPYDKAALNQAIEEFSRLRSKADGVRHVPKLLEQAGVRFVVVEGLPKAAIDGVCFWLHDSAPVIGMSLRYDRIDNFWFVLIHECSHVLHNHGKTEAILDCDLGDGDPRDSINQEEQIANQEAADFCVPSARMNSFYLRKKPFFAEREVEAFAKIVGTHPGLVVGQLQRRMGRYDFLRKHLIKVRETLSMSMMMDGWGDLVPTD